jgi:hypothetical protein
MDRTTVGNLIEHSPALGTMLPLPGREPIKVHICAPEIKDKQVCNSNTYTRSKLERAPAEKHTEGHW